MDMTPQLAEGLNGIDSAMRSVREFVRGAAALIDAEIYLELHERLGGVESAVHQFHLLVGRSEEGPE